MKNIPIHPNDETFVSLMKMVAHGIKEQNQDLINQAKAGFAEGNIDIFYNKETDQIRVILKDAPPVDFPLANFAN